MKYAFIATITLFFGSLLSVGAQHPEQFRKEVFVTAGDSLPYRLLYPKNYNPRKKYPVVLFLHGSGVRGNDNEKQLASVPAALTESAGREKYQSFILVPQCPAKDVWVKFPGFPNSLTATPEPTPAARSVFKLLDSLIAHTAIDKKRVYVTGYSMGGEGALDFIARRPELFAAAVPICSVSDTATAKVIRKIPIWVFHGDDDKVNDVKYSRIMIEALKQQGAKPIYTEYPGVPHNSWTKAYQEPELFGWMFRQRR